jgi:sigma-B regulation protein RsbU (phosphoserine phosphatase)
VTEALNGSGEMFSDARLHQAFVSSAAAPAAEMIQKLVARVNSFVAGAPQEDDITVLVLRYRGH